MLKTSRVSVTFESTDERITGCAGLALFSRYLRSNQLMTIVELKFDSMRKNKKGIPVTDLFIQLLCFFMDGISRHISLFDHLKRDESYAALLTTKEECLASSHPVKRFFGWFSFVRDYLFRCLLQRLFIWRRRKTRPNVIELGIDTMVLENDDARKRQGVQPTYKKVKGGPPPADELGTYMVDAVFRGAYTPITGIRWRRCWLTSEIKSAENTAMMCRSWCAWMPPFLTRESLSTVSS